MGGYNTRYHTVFPKFIQSLGANKLNWTEDYCKYENEKCNLLMKNAVWPRKSPESLIKENRISELSPIEKLSLIYSIEIEGDTNIIAKIKDGESKFPKPNAIFLEHTSNHNLGNQKSPWWAGSCAEIPWIMANFKAKPKNLIRFGVGFSPSDFDALFSYFITRTELKYGFIGTRNNFYNSIFEINSLEETIEQRETYDDINPGAVFLVLTNLLGKNHGKYIVTVDRDPGLQVWNSRIKQYNLRNIRQLKKPEVHNLYQKANKTRKTAIPRSISQSANIFYYMNFSLYHSSGNVTDHPAVIELKNDVIIGGEWLPNKHAHPDFIWFFKSGRPEVKEGDRVSKLILKLYELGI